MSRAKTPLPKTVESLSGSKPEILIQRKGPSGQNSPTRGAKNFDAILDGKRLK